MVTLSDRVRDVTVVVLALWTVSFHITLVLGGHLLHVIGLFIVLGAAVLAPRPRWFREFSRWIQEYLFVRLLGEDDDPGEDARLRPSIYYGFGAVGAFLFFAVFVFDNEIDILFAWWTTVAVLSIAFLLNVREFVSVPAVRPVDYAASREAALWLMAAACGVAALIIHRSSPDDIFYLGLAARAVESPFMAVMSQDPMHGIEGLAIQIPAHRVASHEYFGAMIAFVTGIPVIYVFHWIIAFVATALVPLAYASLLKVLTPRYWHWAVFGVLVVLVATGDTHRSYGNFFLTKPWHGKSILLHVLIPVISFYSMSFMQKPALGSWIMLAAAQVAAVGLSSTALFTAPIVALFSASVLVHGRWTFFARLAAVVASCTYLLAVGLALRLQMAYLRHYILAEGEQPRAHRYSNYEDIGKWLDVSVSEVFGSGRVEWVAFVAIGLSWVVFRSDSVVKRYTIAYPLLLFLTLLNPYFEKWVVANISAFAHWRLLWILPVPVLLALVLARPARHGRAGVFAALLLVGTYAAVIPERWTLDPSHRVRFAWPEAKYEEGAFEAASAINERVPPGSTVIAPARVSEVLPNLHACAFPLVSRKVYLAAPSNAFREDGWFSNSERTRRLRIHAMMDRSADLRENLNQDQLRAIGVEFRAALRSYAISGVVLQLENELMDVLSVSLLQEGFQRVWESDRYTVWIRGDSNHARP